MYVYMSEADGVRDCMAGERRMEGTMRKHTC